MYKLVQKDEVVTVQGECESCHRGSNSLVITNVKHIKEGVDKVYFRCICCDATQYTIVQLS